MLRFQVKVKIKVKFKTKIKVKIKIKVKATAKSTNRLAQNGFLRCLGFDAISWRGGWREGSG